MSSWIEMWEELEDNKSIEKYLEVIKNGEEI